MTTPPPEAVTLPLVPMSEGSVPLGLGRWTIYDGVDWQASDLRHQVYDVELWPDGALEPPLYESGGVELTPGWKWMASIQAYNSAPSGFFDVALVGSRSYTGDGMPKLEPGLIDQEVPPLPVYHGYYTQYSGGKHRGFMWLPKLGLQYMCSKVEILWFTDWMYSAKDGRIAFGYHTLGLPMPEMVDYEDPRIRQHVFEVPMTGGVGDARWIEMVGLADYVNIYRRGGFGVVVGHNSLSQLYYGYGRPLTIRYWWSRDTGWQA